MAFPTGTETTTTLAVMIPALWGERLNDFYKSKLVTADFFVNRSDALANGGNIVYTPNLTEFTAYSKSAATQVTLNQPTETKITLTVDQWYECSFAIEDNVAAVELHDYKIMERYAKNAGYSIAKKLEVAITSLFSTFSTSVGASTTTVADSDIRSAIATLESANVDTSSETAFFFDSAVFWNQLQSIDKFSLAVNAPVQDPVSKRPTAMLYGIPVFVSNNIQYVSGTTGRYNALAQDDAIHFATAPLGGGGSMGAMVGSNGIRVQTNYVAEYLSNVTTADILYGVILNRSTAGVAILSSK